MQAGSPDRVDRRLAAILAADVVGYSRLMEADEAGTARLLREHRAAADPLVAEYGGRIVKTTGDGVLIEFPSVVGAVQCAVALQQLMSERNAGVPSNRRMEWRVGIHLGDILIEGEDILGDGVNLAARLEGIAEPGGICISEDAFRQVRGKIETEFLDGGEQALKNIARPVRIYRAHSASAPVSLASAATAALPLPDKPSIAVLPFQNMSGDPEQEYFADGMVEEIITALSHIGWLFVIARNSTFTYKNRAVDVRQVGRELGVRYVLEGSVRKGSNRVRITGQLIDTLTGTHLWADRFDGSLEDVFELQDKIAVSVAEIIEPTLQAAEVRRSAARPTSDLAAYDLYLRALAVFFPVTKTGVGEALELLERAIAIDPRYGPALAWAAICHMRLADDGWDDRETFRHKAQDLARRALQVAENDPRVLANAVFVLGRYGEDPDTMIALVDRALALNPSYARGWFVSGLLRTWIGQYDIAIEHLERSMLLSPREPTGTPLQVIGGAYFFKREFNTAISKLLLAIQDNPGVPPAYRNLAACYAHMGRLDDARAVIGKLRTITTRIVPSEEDCPWRKPGDAEFYLSGLRLAVGKPT